MDEAEKWLKENDPEYSTRKYYLNNRRFRHVQEKEIPTDMQNKPEGKKIN